MTSTSEEPSEAEHDFGMIGYADLTAKQREERNYYRFALLLSKCGYEDIHPVFNDHRGADLSARRIVDSRLIDVQLKARCEIHRKYLDKPDLYIAFPIGGLWYCLPHRGLVQVVGALSTALETASWTDRGVYSFPDPPRAIRDALEPHRLDDPGCRNLHSSRSTISDPGPRWPYHQTVALNSHALSTIAAVDCGQYCCEEQATVTLDPDGTYWINATKVGRRVRIGEQQGALVFRFVLSDLAPRVGFA